MLDYRPTRSKRTAQALMGVCLGILTTGAWAMAPSPENVLFLGAGLVTGWWMLSRSRSRLVLFQQQGLYWDGFRHVLLNRQQCSAVVEGSETLIRIGQGANSPTLNITHLGNDALLGVVRWCHPTSEDETAALSAPGCR